MTTTVQPPVVSPPAYRRSVRVSTAGYWIGGLLAAAAVVGAICWVVVAFFDYQDRVDSYPRMTVPGVATVQVNDTSTRVIFFEDIRGASAPAASDLGLTVTSPTGTAVPVTSYRHDLRYDVPGYNGRIGHAVARFHPDQTGMYQIRSTPATGVTGTLAIGTDFVWDVVPQAIGAGALFLLGGGAGVALLVVTGVRRSNARRHSSA